MIARVMVIVILLIPSVAAAHSDAEMMAGATATDTWPSAPSVSDADKAAAITLFEEANIALRDALFKRAIDGYRNAIARWDHPAFHHNLAFALIQLDQPLEVEIALERALAGGAALIGERRFERVNDYLQLVRKLIGTLEVTCEKKGAKVTVDGKEIMQGPGTVALRVRAGKHMVVARLAGYTPLQQEVMVLGGETVRVVLKLFHEPDTHCERRRFATWKSYAVLGGGLAITASGFALDASGDRTLAIHGWAIGGAGIATGVLLAIANRPRACVSPPGIEVVPVIGREMNGAMATFRF